MDVLVSVLTDTAGGAYPSYTDSEYYKDIVNLFPNLEDRRAFGLRLVIHFVGDIHQPLHDITEVNSEYTYGDAGGNYVGVADPNGTSVNNLHKLWDSVIWEFADPNYSSAPYAPLPFSDYAGKWEEYTAIVEGMEAAYPWEVPNGPF